MARILQVSSAGPGWYAVYSGEHDLETWIPLACWVVTEEDDKEFTSIDGVDMQGLGADGFVCSETSNFIRFDVEANRI